MRSTSTQMRVASRGCRMEQLQQFISELSRRRVFRALVVWGVVAFAVLQVYEPVMHGLHLPEWTLSFVVVPGILWQHASLLAALGRLPEAIGALREATVLDPLSPDIPVMLSAVYLGTGQIAFAEAAATRALEVSPEHARAARNLGFALLLDMRFPEARAAFHRSSNSLFASMGEVMVEHALGHAVESQRALDGILAQPSVLQGSYQVAQIYAWRGEPDRAFEWLGHAVEQHDPGLSYLKYDPLLRTVRGDARFAALLRQMNLPAD